MTLYYDLFRGPINVDKSSYAIFAHFMFNDLTPKLFLINQYLTFVLYFLILALNNLSFLFSFRPVVFYSLDATHMRWMWLIRYRYNTMVWLKNYNLYLLWVTLIQGDRNGLLDFLDLLFLKPVTKTILLLKQRKYLKRTTSNKETDTFRIKKYTGKHTYLIAWVRAPFGSRSKIALSLSTTK